MKQDQIEKEKQQKISVIRESAAKLFEEKGFSASTMDEIAKESGFTKRTVYSYFKSKEELLSAVTAESFSLMNRYFQKKLNLKTENADEKLRLLAEAHFEFGRKHPAEFNFITEYSIYEESQNRRNPFDEICYREGEISMAFLKETVQQGVDENRIRRDLSVGQITLFLWQSVIGFQILMSKKMPYLKDNFKITESDLAESWFEITQRGISPK